MDREMTGSTRARLLIGGVLLASACLRFRPAALEPPSAFLERCVLCSRVEQGGGSAKPAAEQLLFKGGTPFSAFCFVELRDLRGRHRLQWKWYAPSGALMRRSEEIPVGETGQTFGRYLAWDELRLGPGSERGVWTSSVFLDADLLVTREFEVR
jgi:hypothetical protein